MVRRILWAPLILVVAATAVGSLRNPGSDDGAAPRAPERATTTARPYLDDVPASAELVRRRESIARAIGNGVIVVHGTPAPGAIRSDRNLYYLTGIDLAHAKLIIDVRDGVGVSTLFLPKRDVAKERWDGPRAFPGDDSRERSGIDSVRDVAEFETVFRSIARASAKPSSAPDSESESDSTVGSSAESGAASSERRALFLAKRERRGAFESREQADRALTERYGERWRFEEYDALLSAERQVKSDFELRLIREAIRTTQRGFEAALPIIAPGRYEFELEGRIEGTFLEWGSRAPGFESIIGSGPNSCVLHYNASRRSLRAGEMVVMDIGAQCGAYTADITRTFPVDGEFTDRQREVYEWVLEAQRRAIEAVRPGATFHDLNDVVRRYAIELGVRDALLHGVSHHVGLEVHDVWSRPRLEPGMIITVEPGLYFVDEDLGVRIEDVLLVTSTGAEVLTREIPKRVDEVERWLARHQD